MKPIEHYYSIGPRPFKDEFGKVYVYRAGKTVYEGDLKEWPFHRDHYKEGFTVEKVQDLDAFRAARDAWEALRQARIAEFKADFRADNGLSDPSYDAKFERAYELATRISEGVLSETLEHLEDFVFLIK